jgi:hypothetical protein
MLPSPANLRTTLDAVDEAIFYQRPLSHPERQAITLHILSLQIPSGAQAGMFNHGTAGREAAPRLFTGEPLHTLLAARHTLLIDSVRLLTLLEVKNNAVTQTLKLATQKMEARCYSGFCAVGECRHLTVAFMRYLIASGDPASAPRLTSFLIHLSTHRDNQGKWGSFPFYYTLLMLTETTLPQAALERQYAAAACELALKRPWKDDPFSLRRKAILEKVLN